MAALKQLLVELLLGSRFSILPIQLLELGKLSLVHESFQHTGNSDAADPILLQRTTTTTVFCIAFMRADCAAYDRFERGFCSGGAVSSYMRGKISYFSAVLTHFGVKMTSNVVGLT